MLLKKEKAAEELSSSAAGYQNASSNADSIKDSGADSKSHSHLELARQPHIWRKALYRTNLPASALRVGLALVDKFVNRGKGRCFPSLATIAEECNLSVRTVRDGIEALRRSGLIVTKKRGLRDTLDFTFCLPARAPSNVTDSQHTESDPQCDGFTYSNVTDLGNRDDENPSRNLRKEPPKEPPNKERSGFGPADDVAAKAASSMHRASHDTSHTSAYVEGEPLPFSDIDLDKPIPRPSSYEGKRDVLIAFVGKSPEILGPLLLEWENRPLTKGRLQAEAVRARQAS